MSTLALVEQSVLPHLSASAAPEATAFVAHLLALAPMAAAVVLLVAALSAGADARTSPVLATTDEATQAYVQGRLALADDDLAVAAQRFEREQAAEFANRAERRSGTPRPGPRDRMPKRGLS